MIEPGEGNLSPEAYCDSRVTVGHAEGMPLAFAHIYRDLAEVLAATREARVPDPAKSQFPTEEDGLRSILAIRAAVDSAGRAASASVSQIRSTAERRMASNGR